MVLSIHWWLWETVKEKHKFPSKFMIKEKRKYCTNCFLHIGTKLLKIGEN